ncbi:MAG: DUF2207 domain-containing protein [Candidatus Acidiferrales bacterium]
MLRQRHFLISFCLLFALALPAAARQLVIRHFDERVKIDANASIEVAEMIEVQFIGGPWHGIYRTIPVDYTSATGLNYSLFLRPLSVTNDNGQPLRYETSHQGRYLRFKIYVPSADDSTQTVVIRYRVRNALRFFSDHDELYWNVTGDQSDAPIEAASAHIELPAGVTGLRATAYTGVYGSREQQAQVNVHGNAVDIQTTEPLGYRAGLTAVVGWDKGFVFPPSGWEKTWLFIRSNWPFFIPIVVFFLMLWLWWTRGRDPERDSITVQYDPPDKLSPAECGTLVDDEAGMRDITATLVDLAVHGYMTIEQKQNGGALGFIHHRDYVFHLKKPPAEWTAAKPHEQEMLGAIFESGAAADVPLADLQNRFYTHISAIKDEIFDGLVEDGYYLHRPDVVRQSYLGVGLLVGFLLAAGSGWLEGATGVASFTWIATGIVTAAIICLFGWFMPARTITGAKTYAKVLGFEDFLGRVEKDRIERLEKTPDLFEKYLPYAMALHVEKGWVQQFSGIAMQPPTWFQGYYGAGFMPYLLVSDLSAMSMQAGTMMASAPRSMGGGSGFGGGGMAGGGFGGGGVGGF